MAGYRTLLWEGRRWIGAAALLFFIGIVTGYAAALADPDQVMRQMEPLLGMLRDIGARVTQAESAYVRTWIIFQNNVTSLVRLMAGGVVLGLLPVMGTLANGMIVGVVTGLGTRVSPNAETVGAIAVALVPHAIFELPALWLGAAWGMKVGLAWLMPAAEGQRVEVLRQSIVDAAQVFALVIVLLFIAAAIEANITLSLVRGMAGR